MTASSAAAAAFRESWLATDQPGGQTFDSYEARTLRYALYWAMFENTAYRDVHGFARALRRELGLYRYTRGIYNPAYRLGTTWQMLLWGGQLNLADPTQGALPIATPNAAILPAIAQIWSWSNWQANKNLVTLYGPILGDVLIRVIDDVERRKVYLDAMHPGGFAELTLDPFGNVKGYTYLETRPDPTGTSNTVAYKETAERAGGNVVYRTYWNDQPFAWNGVAAEWAEPYGFVPLVLVRHISVGLTFGWSELHAGRAKFFEADDQGSKLSDQVRKMVDSPWLFSGVEKPKIAPSTTGADKSTSRPDPGREEVPALYAPAGADAKPLVSNLDIAATSAHIQTILEGIEQDYPELQMDIWTVRGDTSGRALRTARQRVEGKILRSRAEYDDALVRAHMMALSIGALRGYAGFEGIAPGAYEAGQLAHAIGERAVFPRDLQDEAELARALWDAASAAGRAGLSLPLFLEEQGWDQARIARVVATPEYQARLAALQLLGGGDEG